MIGFMEIHEALPARLDVCERDEIQPQSDADRLTSIAHIEFAVQVAQVSLDGRDAEADLT